MQLQTRPSSSRGARPKRPKIKETTCCRSFVQTAGGERGNAANFPAIPTDKNIYQNRQKLDSDQWPHAVTYFLNPTHTLSSSTHK